MLYVFGYLYFTKIWTKCNSLLFWPTLYVLILIDYNYYDIGLTLALLFHELAF